MWSLMFFGPWVLFKIQLNPDQEVSDIILVIYSFLTQTLEDELQVVVWKLLENDY